MSTPAITFTRDRPTWFVYLMLATFATYLYGLSSALPTLRAELEVTQAVAGLHGTGMAVGSILTGLSLPWLTRRHGRRVAVWIGIGGMNAGMLLVGLGPTLPFTLAGYTIAGGFAAIALYVSMAALSDHHGPAGPASISEANAVGVLAGIPATYAFSLLAESVLGWRAAMFIPVALTAVLAFAMGRVWFPEVPAEHAAQRTKQPFSWRFHFAGAVLLCCVATEFTFNLFAAELFSQRTGLTLAEAATGLTAMLCGIAAGRFAGAALTLRYPVWQVFLGTMAVTVAGWAVFWSTTSVAVGYAGLAISGAGIGMLFPLGLARMIETSGGRPDQASGIASVWAGVGSGTGPFVLGALGDAFGTHAAFLLAPALLGLAAGGLLSSRSQF
uniref:MFS transporter n=1 Tax=Herbidospora sakaeratensis TaxID=564415 RepID=UPI0014723142|nr:MFS transporter [Herbidospora sakaeratensis]